MTIEEIQSWVKEALASKDREYQLVEVVRTAVELAQTECLKIAEAKQSYSPMPNPSDLDLGWKRCAAAIADEIRKDAGFDSRLKQT